MVPPATHRTILVVDVEKFGDHSRTDAQRVTIHGGLYDLLHEAFQAAGISWDSCYCEDRGDGVMVLAPPDIPKVLFSDHLPYQMASALHRYNLAHRAEERIRLRMALHAGEVTIDGNGVVSSAVNMAFRLLDAAPLKASAAELLRRCPRPDRLVKVLLRGDQEQPGVLHGGCILPFRLTSRKPARSGGLRCPARGARSGGVPRVSHGTSACGNPLAG